MRDWFAEVHRRVDTGLDPFHEPTAGRTEGEDAGGAQGETATDEQTGVGMGNEDEDEDEEDDDDIADDSDDSEVWEPSRSVRKSLSVSED